MGTQLNNSILKAFDILQLFSEYKTKITTQEVSGELGVNNVTANRILKTLEETGALITISKGVYQLGFLFIDLAENVKSHQHLSQSLHPYLERISNELGEAAMLAVFERSTVTVVDMVKPLSGPRLTVDAKKGTRLELHCTSQGKIWLASLTDKQLDKYLRKEQLTKFSDNTITDPEELRKQILGVRVQGYATNREEKEQGLVTVAVPFTSQSDQLIAGISVFGPASRMTEEFLETAIGKLKEISGEAHEALYGSKIK